MRLGLVLERKEEFPFELNDPTDLNSELLSDFEEDELLSGLRDAGHSVVRIGNAKQLLGRIGFWRNRCDLVLNRSVGYRGIERKLLAPSILEVVQLPYVGSTPYVLTLTRHKYHAKLIAAAAGIPTPPSVIVTGNSDSTPALDSLRFPAIVKPVAESSSIGIEATKAIVETPREALDQARFIISRYRQPALVETFVYGTEVEVPLLVDPDPRVLGVAAISVSNRVVEDSIFLPSESVYHDNYEFVSPPSNLDCSAVARLAVSASRAFGMRDYGRIDFRITPEGTAYFIEASTHPHIQRKSSFFWAAATRGLTYPQMLDELISVACRRVDLEVHS